MAKQNKVSLIQTTRRVVQLDFRSTLGSQTLKLLVTPLTPPPKKRGKWALIQISDVIVQVSATVNFQSVRLQKTNDSQLA